MTTLPDQAHNAVDRKLFMMKGFHRPDGNRQAFPDAAAVLYNSCYAPVIPAKAGIRVFRRFLLSQE